MSACQGEGISYMQIISFWFDNNLRSEKWALFPIEINTKAWAHDQVVALSLDQDTSNMCCSSQKQRINPPKSFIFPKQKIGAVTNGIVWSHWCDTSMWAQLMECNHLSFYLDCACHIHSRLSSPLFTCECPPTTSIWVKLSNLCRCHLESCNNSWTLSHRVCTEVLSLHDHPDLFFPPQINFSCNIY